jgi:hypothetical protein
MKIPKSWTRVEGAKCEPERLEYEIRCTERQAAFMELRFQYSEEMFKKYLPNAASCASKPGAVTYMRDGRRRFERCNGVWIERRQVRNPDYVTPPFFQIVYGISKIPQGGCFFYKFPPGMKSKLMMSALTKVANSYGHYARTKGDNRFLLMGCDQEMWDKTDAPRYEWDGSRLQQVAHKLSEAQPNDDPEYATVERAVGAVYNWSNGLRIT